MIRRSPYALARELLLEGIKDRQGTIHANDAKCSAALITHGLLFAGLVTVTAKAAEIYPRASGALPVLALVLGGMLAFAFVVSIVSLLRAVMPYEPTALAEAISVRHEPPGLFFPVDIPRRHPIPCGEEDPVSRQLRTVAGLEESQVNLELVAESVKLAAIRDHEAKYARTGYWALIVEVLLAISYLAVVAATALSTS